MVVEFSVIADGRGVSSFDRIDGFAVTDQKGDFEFTPLDLEVGVPYTLHARAVDWDLEQGTDGTRLTSDELTVDIQLAELSDSSLIRDFQLRYDTGTDDNDQKTSLPTVEGTVDYRGNMTDVVVMIDVNDNGTIDAEITPDDKGYFSYTPEGLVSDANQLINVVAYVQVPDYSARSPEFEKDSDKGCACDGYDGTEGWSTTDDGAIEGSVSGNGIPDQVDAWFADLFSEDGVTLGGNWFNGSFQRDWESLFEDYTSNPQVTSFTLDATQNNAPTLSTDKTVSDLGFVLGTILDDGPSAGLLVSFYLAGELDGTTITGDEGQFVYGFKSSNKGANAFTISVDEPQYEADPIAHEVLSDGTFTVTADANLVVNTFFLTQSTGVTPEGLPIASNPEIAGTISTGGDVALKRIEFDFDNNGKPDATVLTDGLGNFEFMPSNFRTGNLPASFIFRARVVDTRVDDADSGGTGAEYRAIGDWATLEWSPVANNGPKIERYELASETGAVTTVDRITSDPTVVGRISADTGVSLVTVEFDHDNDGLVDGMAVTDENGRFRYTPQGLTEGTWDIRTRVREDDPVTGIPLGTGWQSIVADGTPMDGGANDGTFVGFALIAPTAASVTALGWKNKADQDSSQLDPTLKGAVANSDGTSNVTIDFYHMLATGSEVYLDSTTADSDGNFEFTPVGLPFGTHTIEARASVWNYLTGETLTGAQVKSFEIKDFVAGTSWFFASSPAVDNDAPLANPVLRGTVTTPATPIEGLQFNDVEPLYVEIIREETNGDRQVVTTVPITATSAPNNSGTVVYEYEFAPALYGQLEQGARFNARPVGVDENGLVFDAWTGLSGSLSIATVSHDFSVSENDGKALQPSISGDINTTNISSTALQYDVEIDLDGDGIADDTVALDEDVSIFSYEFSNLSPGAVALQVRVIANVTYNNGDDFERIEGDWQPIDFEFTSPAPTISLALSQPIGTGGNANDTKTPLITGTVTTLLLDGSDATSTVDVAGMTVEIDENLDGIADGTALVLSDGSFEYLAKNVETGSVAWQVRAIDSFSDTEPLVGEWVAFSFALLPKDPPTVNDLALQQTEGTLTLSSGSVVSISSQPTIEGTVTAADYLGNLFVEFDHDGDHIADGTTTVDLFGNYSYTPDNLPFGENAITARAVAQVGSERIEGAWSDTYATGLDFKFFHKSAEPAVISQLTIDDATDGIILGRATVAGFGASVLIEIATGDPTSPTRKGYVRTNSNGAFRYEIPQLAVGTHSIIARGLTNDPNAESLVEGEWSLPIALEYSPIAVVSPLIAEFQLAYNTGDTNDANVTADPTLAGRISNPQPQLEIEFDDSTGGLGPEGTAVVLADGTFSWTPEGLEEGDAKTYRIRTKLWDPVLNDFRYGDFVNAGAWTQASDVSLTLDANELPNVTVSSLEVAYVAGTSNPPTTARPAFKGIIASTGRLDGQLVQFDHNGDGLIDGSTFTKLDGSFFYEAIGLEADAVTQVMSARAVSTDYWKNESASEPVLRTFILTHAPIVRELTHVTSATSVVKGNVFSEVDPASITVEYQLFGDDSNLPVAPTNPGAGFVYQSSSSLQTTTVDAAHNFSIDLVASSVSSLIVRAVDTTDPGNLVVGPWEFLQFSASATTALDIEMFALVEADIDSGTSGLQVTDPTLSGEISGGSAGAFGVIELAVYEVGAGSDVLVSQHRVTANQAGEFTFTPTGLAFASDYRIDARPVAWDAETEQEVFGASNSSQLFQLVSRDKATISPLARTNPSSTDDPTIQGTVINASGRRVSGLRVEFDTDDNQTADAFTFTDSQGNFTYTPLNIGASEEYKIRARVIEWDPAASAFDTPAFGESNASNATGWLTFTLTNAGPAEPELNSQFANKQVAADIAEQAFQELVWSILATIGEDTGQEGWIDVGFGRAKLFNRIEKDNAEAIGDFPATFTVDAPSQTIGFGASNSSSQSTSDSIPVPANATLHSGSYSFVGATNSSGSGGYSPSLFFSISDLDYQLTTAEGTTIHLTGEYSFSLSSSDIVANGNGYNGTFALAESEDFDYWIETTTFTENADSAIEPVLTTTTSTGEYSYRPTSGAPGELATVTGADVILPFNYTETIHNETWVNNSDFKAINTDVQTGTRSSSVEEYSLYNETTTHSGNISTANNSTSVASSVVTDASASFDGNYTTTLDYVTNYEEEGYEQGSEASTQNLHYDGSVHAETTFGLDEIETVFDLQDNLVSSFTQVGSGTAGDTPLGETLQFQNEQWGLYDSQNNIIPAGEGEQETWKFQTKGRIESRSSIAGTAKQQIFNHLHSLDAAFSTYNHAYIEGTASSSASYLESNGASSSERYDGSAQSNLTFTSEATTNEQGIVQSVGDQYTLTGKGDVDFTGSFTSNASLHGNSNSEDDNQTVALSQTNRSGAVASLASDVQYDFIRTNQGDWNDADFNTTLSTQASVGNSSRGTVTTKVTEDNLYPETTPIQNNEATTYVLAVTHNGTFVNDTREGTPLGGTHVGSGHVTRYEQTTNRDTVFAAIADQRDELANEPLYLGLLASGGCSLEKSISSVTDKEEYDYSDTNGAVTREGNFSNQTEFSNDRIDRRNFSDDDTSYSYREDTGRRSNSDTDGTFTDSTGGATPNSYHADTAIDQAQEAFRATQSKFSTQTGDPETGTGNRTAETSHSNTKGRSGTEYSGTGQIDNEEVTQRAGQEEATQLGRVSTGGSYFNESTGSQDIDGVTTKSHTVESSTGNGRSQQTGDSETHSNGSQNSDSTSGEASSDQTGHSTSSGTVATNQIATGTDSREKTSTLSTATSTSHATNSSEGDVSLDANGTDALFDVTNTTGGEQTLTTTRTTERTTDETDSASSSHSTVTRADTTGGDLTTEGEVTLTGGHVTTEAGLPTGKTNNGVTIDFTLNENARYDDAAAPQFVFSTASGTLTEGADTTLASSNGEDLSEVHAKLVRKATEDSTETSGWRSLANDLATGKSSGETTTRKIDGTRNTTAESNIDTAGTLSGEEAPVQKSDYTDKVTVFTWDFDITSLQEYKKNNRTEISTLTENSDENSSSNGIVVTLDVDNRSRSLDGDEVTIAIDTVDSTDTQTNTTTPGDEFTEEKLKITSDKTTTHSTEVKNALSPLKPTVFGKSNGLVGFNFSLTDYIDTTTFVEKSNYDSTHKIDEAGQVSDGEFSADSTYEKNTIFKGSRDDTPMAPDTSLDGEDGDPSREQNRLHIITTQSREADEEGSYSGSGADRTMTGTYTETISSSEEFKEAQRQYHEAFIHDTRLEDAYENAESEYHSTSKLRMNNQSTQIYEGTYGPEGQTRQLTVDTKTIKEDSLFTSTSEAHERERGGDNKETYEATSSYTNVVPNEGTPHGEDTVYVVRTTTDYNMYFTLDIIVTGPDNKPIIGPDGAFTYEQLTGPHIEGLTYYDDLYDENVSLVAKRPVVTLQAAIEAGMIQPASTGSWWWAGTKGAGWGLLQGSANALNGIQDAGIGLLNLGVDAVIPSIPLLGPIIDIPDIPSPDWSRDLVTHEGGEPGSWSDTHGWSKFLGGEGVIALGTGGVSEVRHLRHVRKLKNLDTASDSARLANAAQQTSNTRTVASQLDNLLDDTARQADNGLANAADDFAKPVTETHRNGVYEALNEQSINGTSRSAHRRSANRALLDDIDHDPRLNRQLSEELGVDDLAEQMRSGKGPEPINPRGTEWHHPVERPGRVELLRRRVHRNADLQDVLHPGPNRTGGYQINYGGGN